jgi:methylmalonyl-CoA carboxyltransferase small subunit
LKLQITIDGKAYEVDVEVVEEDENPQAPSYTPQHAMSAMAGGAHHSSLWDGEEKVCQSPVIGLVIQVNAKPGQTVAAGGLLMVLEAMKMETNVTAPRAAKVKNVHVAQGDSVKVNQILIELE